MEIEDLITPARVMPRLKATSKKHVLQELAKRAAELTGLHERAVFDVLLERERLGTTGVGNGIAIPHGDRKSTRLNSSHSQISYAVFCLKKKITTQQHST